MAIDEHDGRPCQDWPDTVAALVVKALDAVALAVSMVVAAVVVLTVLVTGEGVLAAAGKLSRRRNSPDYDFILHLKLLQQAAYRQQWCECSSDLAAAADRQEGCRASAGAPASFPACLLRPSWVLPSNKSGGQTWKRPYCTYCTKIYRIVNWVRKLPFYSRKPKHLRNEWQKLHWSNDYCHSGNTTII